MYRRAALDAMPFPPGVGGGRGNGDAISQSFDVITADRAIDENNVGNRMLRSMGWQEGLVPFFSPFNLHGYTKPKFGFCLLLKFKTWYLFYCQVASYTTMFFPYDVLGFILCHIEYYSI